VFSARKLKAALAVGAGLALAGGLTLTASPARAATPSCGPKCIDIFSKNFGSYFNPQFALDVYRQSIKVGQPLILFRVSNSDPAMDFTVADEGQVSDFYAAGLVSSAFALHYGCHGMIPVAGVQIPCGGPSKDLFAFELEYSPYGVESGLCAGVPLGTVNTKIVLEPCGQTAGTVWAVDTLDSCPFTNPLYALEAQMINGLDTNFSHPVVATYPASGYPTDVPRPQLYLSALTGFSQTGGGTPITSKCGGLAVTGPDNNQLWGAKAGILP
jgi:hypothetical protein